MAVTASFVRIICRILSMNVLYTKLAELIVFVPCRLTLIIGTNLCSLNHTVTTPYLFNLSFALSTCVAKIIYINTQINLTNPALCKIRISYSHGCLILGMPGKRPNQRHLLTPTTPTTSTFNDPSHSLLLSQSNAASTNRNQANGRPSKTTAALSGSESIECVSNTLPDNPSKYCFSVQTRTLLAEHTRIIV